MKQRCRKKIGVRAMRTLLNAWRSRYDCYTRFLYFGVCGIGFAIVPSSKSYDEVERD